MMNKVITYAFGALALTGALATQAHDGATMAINTVADANTSTNLGDTAFGTSQYRTQYEISDLLNAVAEDIASELTLFFGEKLDREEPVDRYEKSPGVASAY